MNYLEEQLLELIESSRYVISDIKPSVWAEKNRTMTVDVSPFPGKFSFDKTPFWREPLDCLHPSHPARRIAIMKGAQLGYSTNVIENGIGWIISESPCPILFSTGHADLSDQAMDTKVDQMIESCGLRKLIRPNVVRGRNNRTGDTTKYKEFSGGRLMTFNAGQHKAMRQFSVQAGFIDDFEAVKSSSKESGSTVRMLEQRFAAYASVMKIFYGSTPERKQTSNIEPLYLAGDRRRYYIPCPCCGTFIFLEWTIDIEGSTEKAGITYKVDSNGKLVEGSVGYVCQSCSGFFNDSNKYELNLHGIWKPTAEPAEPGNYSYHLSSLYASPGMYDWAHYVRMFLEANPINGRQSEALQKTFVNLCLGLTFVETGMSVDEGTLQKNIREYTIGLLPEKISIADGNGQLVMLTCACDLNGTEDDARLDYEIVAWAESGSSYSIVHGSIGTFIPRENSMKKKVDRLKWTYHHNKPNNVWVELEKIIKNVYETDTGRKMKIVITGVDTSFFTNLAYNYIDRSNNHVVGLKGKDADKDIPFGVDIPSFRNAKERSNLYLVEVNKVKDHLASLIALKYDKYNDDFQPPGFMNYPMPANGLYLLDSYFSHFGSEERIIETKDGKPIAACWVKKSSVVKNHFWDVRVYNLVLKDIFVSLICKELGIKNYSWTDYVNIAKASIG